MDDTTLNGRRQRGTKESLDESERGKWKSWLNAQHSVNEDHRRLLRVPWTARRSDHSILKESVLGVYLKDWCWSWNSNTLTTLCKELTHFKRPWCWERLKAGEGDNRGWDGWMASPTQWTWVWVISRSCLWPGRPVMLQSMGSQRVGHDWVTELNWTDSCSIKLPCGCW